MNGRAARILFPVLIGAGVFALLYFVFGAPIILTLFAGVAAAGILFLFLIVLRKTKSQAETTNMTGITKDMVSQTVSQAKEKVQQIFNFTYRIKKPEVKERVMKIVTSCEKIIKDFQDDPKDIKTARNFNHYYLDATINILGMYIKYTKGETVPDDLKERVAKIEEALDTTLQDIFENQYQKAIHDDGIELDVELEMLTKMLQSDRMK
jgi:5-bromo-4-chloroindolyl phosphate hydrolysis protein